MVLGLGVVLGLGFWFGGLGLFGFRGGLEFWFGGFGFLGFRGLGFGVQGFRGLVFFRFRENRSPSPHPKIIVQTLNSSPNPRIVV